MNTHEYENFSKRKQRDHKIQDQSRQAKKDMERKNPPDWTQVSKSGWLMLERIALEAPSAFKLYSFFAQHIDPGCGAVICDQLFLANYFNVTTRTIQKWIKLLEDSDALIKIPVGTTYAYALDPYQVWKGYSTSKPYAAFNTKALTDRNGEVTRKLKIMLASKGIDLDSENLGDDENE